MDNLSFSDILKRLMRKRGDRNVDLAAEININETYVSDWRTGRRSPTLVEFLDLLRYYTSGMAQLLTPNEAEQWARSAGFRLTTGQLQELFPDMALIPPQYLPPPLPSRYVSRHRLENQLKLSLEGGVPIVLIGMAGSGKTTVVKAAAHTLNNHFPAGVLWLDMNAVESEADFHQWFLQRLNLYSPAGSPASVVLRSWFQAHPWLVCLDDVSLGHCNWLRVWLPASGQSRFLLTTRDWQVVHSLDITEIEVPMLTPEEGLHLLSEWARFNVSQTRWGAMLAERLGYHPLGLKLAGAQLRQGASGEELLGLITDQEACDFGFLDLDALAAREDSLLRTFEFWTRPLSVRQKQRLAGLGVFVGTFAVSQAAAVWAETPARTRQELRHLNRFGLVEQTEGQYHLHSLTRRYALSLLEEQPDQAAKSHRRHAVWYIRHRLFHPGLLEKEQAVGPALGDSWADIVAAVRWVAAHQPRLAAGAFLLAHGERPALLDAVGSALLTALQATSRQASQLEEQAMMTGQMAEAWLWQQEFGAAVESFSTTAALWLEAGEYLASAVALLRQAGSHLLDRRPELALQISWEAVARAREAYPIHPEQIEDLRWAFYWFDVLFSALTRWEACPVEIVIAIEQLAAESGQAVVEARGAHIHRLWWTAEGQNRIKSEEDRQTVKSLALKCFWLWRSCGEHGKADEEISWTNFFLKNRYSRRTAQRFARRLSQKTPRLAPNAVELVRDPVQQWWLKATERDRITQLSQKLPVYLGSRAEHQHNSEDGSQIETWVEAVLGLGIQGDRVRRPHHVPISQHRFVTMAESTILSGVQPLPVVGEKSRQWISTYVAELSDILADEI